MSHQHGTVSSRSPSEVILQSIQDRFEIVIRQIQALPALPRFSAKEGYQVDEEDHLQSRDMERNV